MLAYSARAVSAATYADPAPTERAALDCGNCRQPMRRLVLSGHYGRAVELDMCAGCHLVWFDSTEAARLNGPAMLDLIAAMATAQSLPHEVIRAGAGCVRCGAALRSVHNQSRWGRSILLACPNAHGSFQSFAQFLQEKGLLRPMSPADRGRLVEERGHIDCVNCGAAIGRDDAQCSHCLSVPSLLDVARLARSLDPEGAIEPQAVHATLAKQTAIQCAACGAALPPGQSVQCGQCKATLAISRLPDAHASVQALAPALRAHAHKPSPQVVKKRLEALDADLPRRREWAVAMEASAREGRGSRSMDDEFEWGSLFSSGTNPVRAVLIALALWFAWYFWG